MYENIFDARGSLNTRGMTPKTVAAIFINRVKIVHEKPKVELPKTNTKALILKYHK